MYPQRWFAPALLLVGCLVQPLLAQKLESLYKVQPVYPPPLERPAIEVARAALPAKAAGTVPEFDGDRFHLNLAVGEMKETSSEGARSALDALLNAIGWKGAKADIQPLRSVTSPGPNKDLLEKSIRGSQDSTRKHIKGRFGKVNKAAEDALQESAADLRKQAEQTTEAFVFQQTYKGVPIDNACVSVIAKRGVGLTTMSGRVFNTVNITNRQTLNETRAVKAASDYIGKSVKVEKAPATKPMLVLVPYAEGFKYAWRMEIHADGPYEVWIDAENGRVLQLDPLFSFQTAGRGLAFTPSPNVGTEEKSFDVDAASGGVFRLRLGGVLDVNNNGADGVTNNDVTISSSGVTEANFNAAPLNGTDVRRTNQANYNSRFQEVTVYAWVFNNRKFYLDLGSQAFPSITATVNHNNPCGFGINNACASGTSSVTFGIGGATTGTSTSCNQLFNSAIDATVISHEFGHLLNRIQFTAAGGTLPGFINEGLADFWACSIHNTDTFGDFWADNCAAPVQTSFVPRQAEAQDIFPEHKTNFGDGFPHSDGQMICWALWNARTELNAIDALGTFSINFNLVNALAASGVGVINGVTFRNIHDSYIDLLQQLATRYNTSRYIHKILTGFARAGLFLSPSDAVIDINDDYLNRGDAAGPTFTVWTGRDYAFNANGSVNTANQPFNTRFTIEVANDENFTVNVISSGQLGGVTAGAGGSAAWTMPAANWTTVRAQDQIFYRVTTTDNAGGTVRTSGNPGNGFFTNVPVARAIINESGECECACSASAATSPKPLALVTIIPLLVALAVRRRMKHSA
jgi:Zn-dependent metalloprotease